MGLKEIRGVLEQYNVRPSKRLGQNFLADGNIREKILDAVEAKKSDAILEIGPGLGALTQGLCARAGQVIAVEKDRRLCDFLRQAYSASNLEVTNADILDYLETIEPAAERFKAVGNLPYYISSPIITSLLTKGRSFNEIFVTVQKEFAERLVAVPGGKEYGSISCFVRFHAEPRILFKIKRTCFYPAPKVDSCFMRITVRKTALYLTDEQKLFKIIRTCFSKRRKTILNSLKSCGLFMSLAETADALERSGISPDRRPETISLDEFATLTKEAGHDRRE